MIFIHFLVILHPKLDIFMKNKRPLILISNDDGFQSKGINCLIDMVRDLGDIIVCAPDGGRSGYACAFSAKEYLLLEKVREEEGLQVWSCTGTPVDSLKMALNRVVPRTPDLVLAGINHGDNASVNTHYSGTMGVAMEGCMKYIPSVAYSLCDHREDANFGPLRPVIRMLTQKVLAEGLPKGVCLNVNFPLVDEFKGVKVCRMAYGTWGNEVVKCEHPRGYDYYWMVGSYTNDEPEAEDTDNWALTHGYIAITPTQMDVTNYPLLEKWRNEFD
jgi:5'-nucleotidase